MPRVASGSSFGLLCALVLGSASLLSLTGCGIGTEAAPNPVPLTVNGRVQGGQQPVVGAQIQLYAAGSGGNGSASSPLLTTAVMSDQFGSFSITGDYSCPSPNSQVYLVATQGNPGLGSGGNNPALAMMAALGNCGNLTPTQFIWINEVTTVAAAWALAPFTKDISHIGATSTNAKGLANAFLNAQLIANNTNGTAATLASNLTTEPGKIYALANAMASCINSDGTTGCTPFLSAATPSGGSAPTNTWDATVNIVKNPGNNVGPVYSAIGPQPPFGSSLTKAPNDWTLSLTVTGGGLSQPSPLGIDSQGNVWVADFNGGLSGFNPQGTPINGSPFGASVLSESFGLAVDPSDNIWVTVEEHPSHTTKGSVVRLSGVSSGGTLGTTTVFADFSISFPYAVAADTNGNMFLANYAVTQSGVTNAVLINPTANSYTSLGAGATIQFPIALAVDTSHGVWLTSNNDPNLTHLDSTGNVIGTTSCCDSSSAVALDTAGNVWMANQETIDTNDNVVGSVAVLGSNGSVLQGSIMTGGVYIPGCIYIDGAQNAWTANFGSPQGVNTQTISELAGSGSSSLGTAISPSTGYGLDADLVQPYALAVDASGNVWVTNTGKNSLVMFFGLATPTKTPRVVTSQMP